MLKKEQLRTMLDMQAGMNAKVNPNWLDAGYPFLLAAVIEGAEAIEHHGWKWWKAQSCDIEQLRMELVDIWHFALSAEIVHNCGDLDKTADVMFAEFKDGTTSVDFDGGVYDINEIETLRRLELLIGLAAARRFSVALFESILLDCGMTWDDLYRQYVGKNVLNFFRQDNGYKAGTYLKLWEGREDNEHLVEILAIEDSENPNFRERVYAGLEMRYCKVIGQQ